MRLLKRVDVCVFVRSSTDPRTGKKRLPILCEKKGCRGWFWKDERRFSCFQKILAEDLRKELEEDVGREVEAAERKSLNRETALSPYDGGE